MTAGDYGRRVALAAIWGASFIFTRVAALAGGLPILAGTAFVTRG